MVNQEVKGNIVDYIVECGGINKFVFINRKALIKASEGTHREFNEALDELMLEDAVEIHHRESQNGFIYYMYKVNAEIEGYSAESINSVEKINSGIIDIEDLPVGYKVEISRGGNRQRTYVLNLAGECVGASCSCCRKIKTADLFTRAGGRYKLYTYCKECKMQKEEVQKAKKVQEIKETNPVQELISENEIIAISEVVADAVVDEAMEEVFERLDVVEKKVSFIEKIILKLKDIFQK